MRGIAALGVMCIHFATSTLPTIKPNPLGEFFQWAHLGIPIFFIISGFIIPYAMYTGGYRLAMAGKFFLKRMIRMVPPAWAALLLMFAVYYGAIVVTGSPIAGRYWPGTDPLTVLGNLFFSFKLLDVGKYIDLYWTLEVEFQYYLVIIFLLPLVLKFASNQVVLTLILLVLNATYLLNDPEYPRFMFFRDNAFFIIGMLLFLYKMKLITKPYFAFASLLFVTLCYIQHDMFALTASVICLLFINYVKFNHPALAFLGMISYSLYITHHMSGVVAEFVLRNISGLTPSDPVKVIMLAVYCCISVFFAWLFYKAVEEPSLRWSKKIHLGRKKDKVVKSLSS
jgi:peptidoglycan/LPS O-acetylase OafA/YrhL